MVIDGRLYETRVDVDVTIDGSYGAITMLTPEMRALFEYETITDTRARITQIDAWHGNEEVSP